MKLFALFFWLAVCGWGAVPTPTTQAPGETLQHWAIANQNTTHTTSRVVMFGNSIARGQDGTPVDATVTDGCRQGLILRAAQLGKYPTFTGNQTVLWINSIFRNVASSDALGGAYALDMYNQAANLGTDLPNQVSTDILLFMCMLENNATRGDSMATMHNEYYVAVTKAAATCPPCQIVIASDIIRNDGVSEANAVSAAAGVWDHLNAVGGFNLQPYLDLVPALTTGDLSRDGLHLTNASNNKLGIYIANALSGL